MLYKTVQAFQNQTFPPEAIAIVDNNDEFGSLRDDLSTDDTGVFVLKNDYYMPREKTKRHTGIAQGDQTCLNFFNKFNFKIAARWDDDLVPEPDCMDKLLDLLYVKSKYPYKVVAVGGMYPGPNGISLEMGDGFSRIEEGVLMTGNGNPRHLQFFRWGGLSEDWIERKFLYSSFVYKVETANLVGGFCVDYSPHSFRADTDFTLRMNEVGRMYVNTGATATHYFETGGTRAIVGKEKQEMKQYDLELFDKRMRMMGIDPNY